MKDNADIAAAIETTIRQNAGLIGDETMAMDADASDDQGGLDEGGAALEA